MDESAQLEYSKCVGFGALDSAISALVLGKAKDLCIGTLVPF